MSHVLSTIEFQAYRHLQDLFKARGLVGPNGLALYKYNLTEQEVAALKATLCKCFAQPLPAAPRSLGALFCLWTAFWFQREFSGGTWKWEGPTSAVSAPNDPASRALLVIEGMSLLDREIRKSENGNEYLGTLIVEGGFPARLISENSGWLPRYIQAVTVASTNDGNSPDLALEHARYYQTIVPPYFRAASLIELTAKLAYQVAELRRQVASHGFNGSAVEWLDSVKPGWREQLPIPADETAAKLLVEGLVRASSTKAVMPVTCRRLLRKTREGWIPCVRLEIEGRIDDDQLPPEIRTRLQSLNRARILPTGLLERRGLPAVGIANRTDDENWSGWQVTSLLGSRPTTIDNFPLEADARFIFSAANAAAIDYVPTGGARIISRLLVFREDAAVHEPGDPESLSLAATFSIKDRDARLYVAAPADAVLSERPGGEATAIGTVGDKTLFRVRGGLDIRIGEDHYAVIAGAEQSESVQIEAVGHNPERFSAHLPIYRGAPSFLIHHGVLKKKADATSLKMRIFGRGQPWRSYDARHLPFGVVEVATFAKDGTVLDRLTFAHVPATAEAHLSIPAPGTCRIQIRGLAPATVVPLARDGHQPEFTPGGRSPDHPRRCGRTQCRAQTARSLARYRNNTGSPRSRREGRLFRRQRATNSKSSDNGARGLARCCARSGRTLLRVDRGARTREVRQEPSHRTLFR